MTDEIRGRTLSYSARPEAHELLDLALGRAGVNVRVARHPDRALMSFHLSPTHDARVGCSTMDTPNLG